MQAIIFIGLQATGKSTFYQSNFFHSHIRINLDMLRTRHREKLLFQCCLEMKQPFVIDNTNPTPADRTRYISVAKEAGFQIVGYYFQSQLSASITRNQLRPPAQQIPDRGIRATHAKLVLPEFGEGFDELYYVSIANREADIENTTKHFIVQRWQDEI
ncbi:MAG: AAA family ATPase [Chloroflexota bacterium]